MNDPELFELCKQVYEATGWDNTSDYYHSENHYTDSRNKELAICPRYTSDYLLEKLPTSLPRLGERSRDIVMDTGYIRGDFVWRFGYDNGFSHEGTIEAFGSTPLKALLRLTLALQEAKLL